MPNNSTSKRGVFRAGAGRKKGSSAYGELTAKHLKNIEGVVTNVIHAV